MVDKFLGDLRVRQTDDGFILTYSTREGIFRRKVHTMTADDEEGLKKKVLKGLKHILMFTAVPENQTLPEASDFKEEE